MWISSPDASGNVFIRQLGGSQLFRVQNDLTQYCFQGGSSEAPFQINSSSADEVVFCWRGQRLPTHKLGCTGCDCAQWTLHLDGNTLQTTFMMSPPALHMKGTFIRSGSVLPPETVSGGWPCEFNNHTGHPLNNSQVGTQGGDNRGRSFCTAGFGAAHKEQKPNIRAAKHDASNHVHECVVMNKQHNVRLEYDVPALPCMPCNVTFRASADMPPSSSHKPYFAIGFKGSAAEYLEAPLVPELPNYWGMASGEAERNFSALSGRIVLGVAGNSTCVRQLLADAYVGSIVDVEPDSVIQDSRVTNESGRIGVTFTVSMHVGRTKEDLNWRKNTKLGFQRVMWALGTMGGDSCTAPVGFHAHTRGLVHLNFKGLLYECDDLQQMSGPGSVFDAMLETDSLVFV